MGVFVCLIPLHSFLNYFLFLFWWILRISDRVEINCCSLPCVINFSRILPPHSSQKRRQYDTKIHRELWWRFRNKLQQVLKRGFFLVWNVPHCSLKVLHQSVRYDIFTYVLPILRTVLGHFKGLGDFNCVIIVPREKKNTIVVKTRKIVFLHYCVYQPILPGNRRENEIFHLVDICFWVRR